MRRIAAFLAFAGSCIVSMPPSPKQPRFFDGKNEKGLAANLLYLAENDFGLNSADSRRPRLSFAAWTLYLLSQYGSVKELVAAVQQDRIQIAVVQLLKVSEHIHVYRKLVCFAAVFKRMLFQTNVPHQVSPSFPLIQATASAAVSTVSVSSSSSSAESSARNSPVVVGVLNWMFSPLV